ncbi:GAF domain-containing protein [Streptomyces lunaelactis]|nr:GAF domain-containing protein [Streptomyces lunaelactis]NUK09586.1 GAF domain-containing protein [Streptomyces lunaelactis]NUK25772.1 GAF domain-containing protein [Streptomyces lunaelactis]NUK35662.1 GAF domain-containing protein [Streptomyces lunaelactis]NUK43743.1 GAF domain-containing protein [Streptomyces lunaelactis]NUK58695.1 GAF domain-containing protein [Streptomyces lunaelactis]
MQNTSLDMARLAAMDTAEASRFLKGVRDATLNGRRSRVRPRADIQESWQRMLRGGVDPDRDHRAGLLPLEEIERRRLASPLREVLPVLRDGLVSIAEAAQHIMVVADTEGRLLWREGKAAVLRMGDAHGFVLGADWHEGLVGTNGVGTPLVTGRPVQVHAAEHFVSSHDTWTCAGAPVTDPRDGRLIGVVDISGPLSTMHPATLSLVTSVTRLAEAELRNSHFADLDQLRSVASPLLGRLRGRALAVDHNGWQAAVTGMPPTRRLPLPKSLNAGRLWLPSLGMCTVEPLPGGWLVRVEEESSEPAAPARVVLDLSRPRRPSVTVSGTAGSWLKELSPRHAELLYVLMLHRNGRSAAQLAQEIFQDPTRTVTVRAEMSRLRRHLAQILAHRPYRIVEEIEVELVRPDDPADLLPHSTAPAVVSARSRQE